MAASEEFDLNPELLSPPIIKEITKQELLQRIDGLTGKGLLQCLTNLVDKKWKNLEKVLFYTQQPDEFSKPLFVIEVVSTKIEPGNGLVKIRTHNDKLLSYSFSQSKKNGVQETILSTAFMKCWDSFWIKPFESSKLVMTKKEAACILLTFEIARRTKNEKKQLKRKQVSDAIFRVMNLDNLNHYQYLVCIACKRSKNNHILRIECTNGD